ncbi:MAG TPA: hypothetical protein VFI34_07535 [Candidatus Limnocylindrales bacterium]|nr:hypothetical protein [Candidatus Limnocylindrales bacterium]
MKAIELVCRVVGHRPKPFAGRTERGRLAQGTACGRCGRILQATRRLPRATRRRLRFGRR